MSFSQSSSSDVLVVDEVVFKEKNIYDDDCDPWTSAPASQTQGSQGAPDHDETSFAARSHQEQLLPRHERKRRLQALEKAYEEDSESSPSSTPPDHNPLNTNPFAVLETMITSDASSKHPNPESKNFSQESSCQDTQCDAPVNVASIEGLCAPADSPTPDARRDSQQVEGPSRVPLHQNFPSQVRPQPDFPSNQDSATVPGVGSHYQHQPLTLASSISTLANPTESNGRATARSRIRDTRAVPNHPSSLLDDHRHLALLDHSRRNRHRQTREKPNCVTKPSQASRSGVKRAPSIVGSRPQHWGTARVKSKDCGTSIRLSTSLLSFTSQQKSRVASELDRAIQSRKLPPPNNRSGSSPSGRGADASDRAEPNNSLLRPESSNQVTGQTQSSRAATPPVGTAPVSFAPAFLVRTTVIDDVIEDSGVAAEESALDSAAPLTHPFSNHRTSPFRSGATSPARKKTKGGSGGGALVQRLKQVRDGVRGDVIRLQSGQYPFSATATRFDVNDPRHRAKSRTDVTLLGDPVLNDPEHEKVAYRAFVHAHRVDGGDMASSHDPTGCLVWAYFSYTTARERNLQPSCELRIYNAVPLAVSRPIVAESTGTSGGRPTTDPSKSLVEWIILATQVCEPYPDALPRLADPQTLFDQPASST